MNACVVLYKFYKYGAYCYAEWDSFTYLLPGYYISCMQLSSASLHDVQLRITCHTIGSLCSLGDSLMALCNSSAKYNIHFAKSFLVGIFGGYMNLH